MMDAINTVLTPLYYAVSAILLAWHWLFSHLFGPDSGATWALSIVGLVLVIRTCLIPLFVKQIRSSRNMQVIQPKVKALQKKYGDDREKFSQELMKLYKETGTNPLSSCLPILIQSPILYSLFRVLDGAAASKQGGLHGFMTQAYANSLANATIFGAPISDKFLGSSGLPVKILAVVLILAMTGAMFFTQLQLMRKNMPASAQTGQFAQQQKIILYLFPIAFAVGGVSFPIGVLIYWLTTNIWTAGQQYLVIKNNPTPDTDAYEAFIKKHGHPPDKNRKARREREQGESDLAVTRAEAGPATAVLDGADDGSSSTAPDVPSGPVTPNGRVQPKRQTRSKRRT
jgi:YidC/Oxa1 family membrane protein insertase